MYTLPFTPLQLEIMKLIVNGQDSRRIAHTLKCSYETVKYQRKAIMKLTGCKNVAQLVAMCVQEGIM